MAHGPSPKMLGAAMAGIHWTIRERAEITLSRELPGERRRVSRPFFFYEFLRLPPPDVPFQLYFTSVAPQISERHTTTVLQI